MRRLIVVLAAVSVLLAGGIAAIVLYRLHQEGNIRGSSTEEFTLPTTTAKPPATPLHVSWPQYGFDPTRDRAVQLELKPPFRRVDSHARARQKYLCPSCFLSCRLKDFGNSTSSQCC